MKTLEFLPLTLLLLLTSCGKPSPTSAINSINDQDSLSAINVNGMPSDEEVRAKVVELISKNDLFTTIGLEFQSEETADGVEISAKEAAGQGWTIPMSDYLKGDLNDDGKVDILVPVYSYAGTQEYLEYYLLLSSSADYPFYGMYDSRVIADSISNNKVLEYGQFYINSIDDGMIVGTSMYHGGDEELYHDFSYMCKTEKYKLNLETRKFELVYESPLLKRRNNSEKEVYDEVIP